MRHTGLTWLVLLILVTVVVGCEADQWLVIVSTDAPVPQLGDRLLVEILPEDMRPCVDCRRLISVGDPARWPVTFGVTPLLGVRVHVRARLYREDHADAEGMPAPAFVDRIGWLPDATREGVVPLDLPLSLNCFGVPSVIEQNTQAWTCDPSTMAPGLEQSLASAPSHEGALRPGTWDPAPALPQDCTPGLQIPYGMACIPGGIFVLGGVGSFPIAEELTTTPERLVRMRRFAMDIDEYKVKDLYSSLSTLGLGNLPSPVSPDYCTQKGTGADATNEKPANCVVSRSLAEDICALRGGRLPTEAEWEYVAGNLAQETKYSWGDDPDICAHAIVERAATLGEIREPPMSDTTAIKCRYVQGAKPFGAVVGGHPGDVTRTGIHNLMGNVAEWVADAPAPYSAPCWTPQGRNWLEHPRCRESPPGLRTKAVARGTSFLDPLILTSAIERRQEQHEGGGSPTLGFRCVRDL